jgi:glycerol-3-phosphate acyltransferase PlsY
VPAAAVLAASFAAGSVPFSQLAARLTRDVDLRTVGTGTVSGTSLYRVAGFGPLAVAGVCDIAKGSVGPLLAGRDRPVVAALAGSAAVCGHDWSPWLRGAGGRGISPAMGALLPRHPEGSLVLLSGLALGRIVRQTGLGSAVADAALVPLLARRGGRTAALAAVAVVTPMLVKRLLGDHPLPAGATPTAYLRRLLLDNDGEPPTAADSATTPGTLTSAASPANGSATAASPATDLVAGAPATEAMGKGLPGGVAEAADPSGPAGSPTPDRAAPPGGAADPTAAADGAGAGGVEGGRR